MTGDSAIFQNYSDAELVAKIKKIQKLGEFFRIHYPDWRIALISEEWEEAATVWVRQIEHMGQHKVLAKARVEVPLKTFKHFQTELSTLGSQSIGDHFLFRQIECIGSNIEVFKQNNQWLRQRSFYIEGLPLQITEWFTEEGLACLRV